MSVTHSSQRSRTLLAAATLLAAILTASAATPAKPPANSKAQIAQNYGKLPLSFEANEGQSDPRVKFLSRGNGYSLFLTDHAAVLSLSKNRISPNSKEFCHPERSEGSAPPAKLPPPTASCTTPSDIIEMQLANANPAAQVVGAGQLPGQANYFLGNDPKQWHTDVPTYAQVRYTSVYDGIDLVYYGNQRQLEYDFIVQPGHSANQIQLHFAGAQKLKLDPNGDLEVIAKNGQISFQKPVLYQENDGIRQPIEGSFRLLANNQVSFAIGKFDPTRALVIDPLLAYSTYLGGSGAYTDEGYAIAVDSKGSAYVTGDTNNPAFPTTADGYQQPTVSKSCCGNGSVFVTKLNPEGTGLVYSTYLDGNQDDHARAITVDSAGDAYITGTTNSTDFPVSSLAYQPTRAAAYNVFVTKLNPTGSALIYSTYIGGNGNAVGSGIAVDASGNAFVTGNAVPGFACGGRYPTTTGAFQTEPSFNGCGDTNAFITRLSSDGSKLAYSTYLGGPGSSNSKLPNGGGDYATAIAVDADDNAYVAGVAGSTTFPITTGAFQTVNNGANTTSAHACDNGFVTKINAKGSALIYSTYLGGSGSFDTAHNILYCDTANALAIDTAGNAYIGGTTGSQNFPTTKGAYLTTNPEVAEGGFSTGFVTKLNPTGTALVYSTYLGGSDGSLDGVNGLGIDKYDQAYVTGFTYSEKFPVTTGAYQKQNPGASALAQVPFVTELNAAGTAPLFSSYFGGDDGDFANAIAVDAYGSAYITGQTGSTDFPVTLGAFQQKNNETTSTAFVAKLNITTPISPAATPVFTPPAGTYTGPQKITIATATPGASIYYTTNGTAPTTASTRYTAAFTVSSSETLEAIAVYSAGGYSSSTVAIAKYVIETPAAPPVFTPPAGTYTSIQKVTVTSATTGAIIYCTTNGTTPTAASTKYAGPITVATTETLECIAEATGYAPSTVAIAKYVIDLAAATPVISPAPGIYAAPLKVTITDASAGVTLYYTTNGTAPTTASARYTGPITVTATETIEAMAQGNGYTASPVAIAKYTIESVTATPVFTPLAGTYESVQSVAITSATPGAAIYYTTNGTAPTTASTKYTAPITVSGSETLEAIAVATGYINSNVVSAAYKILGSPSALAAPATAISNSGATLNAIVNTLGLTGTTYFQYGVSNTALTSTTPKITLGPSPNPVAPTAKLTGLKADTTYYFQVVVSTAGGTSSSAILSFTTGATAAATPEVKTVGVFAPTFSPAAGTYATSQTVKLTSATPGAVICYSTNGIPPNSASCTRYTGPITVGKSETIDAIAVASGRVSATSSAKYTIE